MDLGRSLPTNKRVSLYFGFLFGVVLANLYCLYYLQLQIDEEAKRLAREQLLLQYFLTPGAQLEPMY